MSQNFPNIVWTLILLGTSMAGCSGGSSMSIFKGHESRINPIKVSTKKNEDDSKGPNGRRTAQPNKTKNATETIAIPVDVTGVLLTADCIDSESASSLPDATLMDCSLQPVDNKEHKVRFSGVSMRINAEQPELSTVDFSGRLGTEKDVYLMSKDWPVRFHFKFPTSLRPADGLSQLLLTFEKLELPEALSSTDAAQNSSFEFIVQPRSVDVVPDVCQGDNVIQQRFPLHIETVTTVPLLQSPETLESLFLSAINLLPLAGMDSILTPSNPFGTSTMNVPLARRTSVSARFPKDTSLRDAVICSARFASPIKPDGFNPVASASGLAVYVSLGRAVLFTTMEQTLQAHWFNSEAATASLVSSSSFDENIKAMPSLTTKDWCALGAHRTDAKCTANMGNGEVMLQGIPSPGIRELTQQLLNNPSLDSELNVHFIEQSVTAISAVNGVFPSLTDAAKLIESRISEVFNQSLTAFPDPKCPKKLVELEVTYVK